MSYNETYETFQKVHAWALQRKEETKASWSDITVKITWAFTGILKLWWEKLTQEEKDAIL